ncbi:MAG TPA: nickel ABC transporter permease [Terriglobia bacterium]|jgi:ABC-type dipeptide/oligopeptide/nickel transport system permease component|nr:nickel ABC transporter permease [Terriglobia bacterium]
MRGFLLRRLLLTVPVLFGVVTLVFSFIHLVPGDPVQIMLGEGAQAVDVEQLRHKLGLDQPILTQYGSYLKDLLRGDLGVSFRFGEPVTQIILSRYPATMQLACLALAVGILIAVPAGVLAATRPGSWLDRTITSVTLLGISLPNFVLGPLAIIVFSILLGWLPVSGRLGPAHYVLPAATLGAALSAILTRMVRAGMIEELQEEYVKTARAKGLPESKVLLKHALKNSLIPVVTVIGLQFGTLLAGAIITETIFSWPGIGRLTIQAINSRDYPLVQGCILMIASTYVAVNLLTDLVYGFLDPRIKYQ